MTWRTLMVYANSLLFIWLDITMEQQTQTKLGRGRKIKQTPRTQAALQRQAEKKKPCYSKARDFKSRQKLAQDGVEENPGPQFKNKCDHAHNAKKKQAALAQRKVEKSKVSYSKQRDFKTRSTLAQEGIEPNPGPQHRRSFQAPPPTCSKPTVVRPGKCGGAPQKATFYLPPPTQAPTVSKVEAKREEKVIQATIQKCVDSGITKAAAEAAIGMGLDPTAKLITACRDLPMPTPAEEKQRVALTLGAIIKDFPALPKPKPATPATDTPVATVPVAPKPSPPAAASSSTSTPEIVAPKPRSSKFLPPLMTEAEAEVVIKARDNPLVVAAKRSAMFAPRLSHSAVQKQLESEAVKQHALKAKEGPKSDMDEIEVYLAESALADVDKTVLEHDLEAHRSAFSRQNLSFYRGVETAVATRQQVGKKVPLKKILAEDGVVEGRINFPPPPPPMDGVPIGPNPPVIPIPPPDSSSSGQHLNLGLHHVVLPTPVATRVRDGFHPTREMFAEIGRHVESITEFTTLNQEDDRNIAFLPAKRDDLPVVVQSIQLRSLSFRDAHTTLGAVLNRLPLTLTHPFAQLAARHQSTPIDFIDLFWGFVLFAQLFQGVAVLIAAFHAMHLTCRAWFVLVGILLSTVRFSYGIYSILTSREPTWKYSSEKVATFLLFAEVGYRAGSNIMASLFSIGFEQFSGVYILGACYVACFVASRFRTRVYNRPQTLLNCPALLSAILSETDYDPKQFAARASMIASRSISLLNVPAQLSQDIQVSTIEVAAFAVANPQVFRFREAPQLVCLPFKTETNFELACRAIRVLTGVLMALAQSKYRGSRMPHLLARWRLALVNLDWGSLRLAARSLIPNLGRFTPSVLERVRSLNLPQRPQWLRFPQALHGLNPVVLCIGVFHLAGFLTLFLLPVTLTTVILLGMLSLSALVLSYLLLTGRWWPNLPNTRATGARRTSTPLLL